MFRHTVANDWLAGGGSEGDLMRLMGWHDRSMVDRYAADMQDQRAFEAKRRRGDMYGTSFRGEEGAEKAGVFTPVSEAPILRGSCRE